MYAFGTTVAVITRNIIFLLENHHVALSHSGWGASLCTYVSGTQYWMINENPSILVTICMFEDQDNRDGLFGGVFVSSDDWTKKNEQLLLMKSCTTWDVQKNTGK